MTTTNTKMLRPGLLVSLSVRISGGVIYDRKDLDVTNVEKNQINDVAAISRWETTKVIDDPAEYERAVQTRGKCRNLIASVCAKSDFGLLCPSSREFDLARAMDEAQRIAGEHNASARRSFVSVYSVKGRIAQDDVEAARAVASEVRALIDAMNDGIKAADPAAIREAANKAKNLSAMLTDDATAKVTAAIDEARKAAREIVKRVEKDGEVAAKVIAEQDVAALNAARAAFLDLDDVKSVETQPVAVSGVDLVASSEPSARINVGPVADIEV